VIVPPPKVPIAETVISPSRANPVVDPSAVKAAVVNILAMM
jgi:hypothetical protein